MRVNTHAWLKSVKGVCSVHVAYLHLAFSVFMFHPPSLLLPNGHFDSTFPSTVFVELYPTQKRGSSALPHERRGVKLPGRSHAFHTACLTPTWLLETPWRHSQTKIIMRRASAFPDLRKWGCRENSLRVTKICKIRNLMRDNFFDSIKATMEKFFPRHFSAFTDFSFGAMYRTFSRPFCLIFASLVSTCWGSERGVASSGVCTPDVELGALHRSAPRVRRWTTLSLYKKCTTIIRSHRLSGVSRVRCPVCPCPHPCFHVLTTSPRHSDSDKLFFFVGLKKC